MFNHNCTDSFYEIGRARLNEIKREKKGPEARLSKAPRGSVRFIERNGRVKFYLRTDPKDKSGVYLRKSEEKKIKIYLQKKYDEKVLSILEKEEKALGKLLEKFEKNPRRIQELYSALPKQVKSGIMPVDISDADFAEFWQTEPFEGKKIREDLETLQTDRGEYVRSKSELTIANALNRKQIPYKYECPLQMRNSYTIYPDFTVLNVRTRKVYYWEHRGMMDDMEYARGAVSRQKEYIRSGIMLGDRLVITEETVNSILSTAEIEAVINTYFL